MSFIFVIEIGVSIASYILREELERNIEKEVQLSMNKYNEEHAGVMKTWDIAQHDVNSKYSFSANWVWFLYFFQYMCCGARNYQDWENTVYGGQTNGVPDSCCKTITVGCGEDIFLDDERVG